MRAILVVMVFVASARAEKVCPTAAPCVVKQASAYAVNDGKQVHVAASQQAVVQTLTKLKATSAMLSCDVAVDMPALAGLGATISIPVTRSTAKPVPKIAAKDLAAVVDQKLGSSSGDLFSADQLAAMTAKTFKTPTLLIVLVSEDSLTCTGEGAARKCVKSELGSEHVVYIVYSPESAHAYVADAKVTAKTQELPAKKQQLFAGALASVMATLAPLGHKTLAVERDSMCAIANLPNGGWFEWKAR